MYKFHSKLRTIRRYRSRAVVEFYRVRAGRLRATHEAVGDGVV